MILELNLRFRTDCINSKLAVFFLTFDEQFHGEQLTLRLLCMITSGKICKLSLFDLIPPFTSSSHVLITMLLSAKIASSTRSVLTQVIAK